MMESSTEMTASQVPDWEGLFEVLDADGSGALQWDELREGPHVSFWLSFYVLLL